MKYPNIIGREVEISTLERLYKSKKSEFVAIYGRRRIGKSYLVIVASRPDNTNES